MQRRAPPGSQPRAGLLRAATDGTVLCQPALLLPALTPSSPSPSSLPSGRCGHSKLLPGDPLCCARSGSKGRRWQEEPPWGWALWHGLSLGTEGSHRQHSSWARSGQVPLAFKTGGCGQVSVGRCALQHGTHREGSGLPAQHSTRQEPPAAAGCQLCHRASLPASDQPRTRASPGSLKQGSGRASPAKARLPPLHAARVLLPRVPEVPAGKAASKNKSGYLRGLSVCWGHGWACSGTLCDGGMGRGVLPPLGD